ncbi:hypothetical protein B0H13DRAFT_1914109 [Mycena leptocephala]|nr:hypothetical protein B0H13DRAFT_1914109 [Mycena leptocephala]
MNSLHASDVLQQCTNSSIKPMPAIAPAASNPIRKRLSEHRFILVAHRQSVAWLLLKLVGSALLQLVAIQQELDEPLNLNGDLLGDLLDDRVVHCLNDGEAGLEAMFLVSGGGPMVADRMLKFKSEHVIYDEEYRPHTFRRLEESRFPATDPIPVIVKRKGDQEIEGERPLKREKANQGKKTANSKAKAGAKAKAASKAPPKHAPFQHFTVQHYVKLWWTGSAERLRIGKVLDVIQKFIYRGDPRAGDRELPTGSHSGPTVTTYQVECTDPSHIYASRNWGGLYYTREVHNMNGVVWVCEMCGDKEDASGNHGGSTPPEVHCNPDVKPAEMKR